jgi:protein ImuB
VVAAGVAPDDPAVVVFANRVRAATPAARTAGIRTRMRRREAQGRCPSVAVIEADEARDARAFEPVVLALESLTPRLELTRPGALCLPTRGPSRYFGGDTALACRAADDVGAVVGAMGWPGAARVGVADGPFAAERASRAAGPGEPFVVEPGASAEFLAPLPVAALGRPELAGLLGRLGLCTLGAFAGLDAGDVLARFGDDGLIAHRLASGLDERPPALTDPPADLAVTAELDPPVERVDTAAFVARGLADELNARLAGRGMCCTRVVVLAESEHGERRERTWRHEGLAGATPVVDRVRWQLEGWLNGPTHQRPTAGISLLRLVPEELGSAGGRQLGFWGASGGADEAVIRALARVQGMVGPEAVRVPEWRGARAPGEQVRLVSAGAVDLSEARPGASAARVRAPWPGRLPDPAPTVVPTEPSLVELLDERGLPVTVGARAELSAEPVGLVVGERTVGIAGWAGPWPAEERWWDGERHRRRARLQLVTDAGWAVLVAVEAGRWHLEAHYD